MAVKTSDVRKYKPGTPEYVVLHGQWKQSRGRGLSATLPCERNPRKALEISKQRACFPIVVSESHGTRPWYDNKEIIEQHLCSLSGLRTVLNARHNAGYQFGERLNEYYIRGRFWLDSCGNCLKAIGFVPKDEFPNMPDVLTKDEFFCLLGDERMVRFGMGSDIPDKHIECPFCGKSWELYNCHDTVCITSTEVYRLDEFVGKTLGEVKATYAARTDAKYFMQPDILVRNDRFIDLSLKYPDTDKDWEKNVVVNERGWMSERDGITDEYVVQAGDEGFFNKWKYYHSQCHLDSVTADPDFLGNNGHFKNLAGAAYADIVIKKELVDAGIEVVQGERTRSEVPYTLTGKLGNSTFVRAWTYWMVECMVPLTVAQEMYADEVGAKCVRVAGHCGCPAPEEWATYYGAEAFVTRYHIDTMQGLKLFVETLRRHNLVL